MPWVAVEIAPAMLWRSMSPRLGRARPRAASLLVEAVDGDPRLDGHGRGGLVDADDPVELVEREHPAVGARDVRERVAGTDDLDVLPRGAGSADSLDDLVLAARCFERGRSAALRATPVAPDVLVAHRTMVRAFPGLVQAQPSSRSRASERPK